MAKRLFDMAFALATMLLTLPITIAASLLIWLQDGHFPLYAGVRVGRGGRDFRMFKLRTMVPNGERLGGSSTATTDSRLTPLGAALRRHKIDELPQFWNVLIGDMSIVGPRPNVRAEVERYTVRERELLTVRPGITDLASVVFSDEGEILKDSRDPDALYDSIIRPWKNRLGLIYVDQHSLFLDLQLIWVTALAIGSRAKALRRIATILNRLGADDELRRICSRTEPLPKGLPPCETAQLAPAGGTPLRVFLLVFSSGLFMPPLVEHVVVAGQFDVVGVGGVAARKRGSTSAWLRAQIGYWGIWPAAWIAAATVFGKLPALLRFPRVFRRLSSLAETCRALEIPYENVPDVNDPAFVSKLRELEVDVIVSFQQRIFKTPLLQAPKLGCLNVHTGILPGYRGSKPVFWMHARREPEMGVTVHTMTERIDTGRIVVQRRWKRRARSSVLENQLWSYRCAAHCIVEAVERLGGFPLRDDCQIPDSSPYFKPPTKAERELALASGTRLF